MNHFYFEPISYAEVYKALKAIDTKRSAGPDNLDPYLLKIADDDITEPVAHIFNFSPLTNSIGAPKWRGGQRHCISVLEASLQTTDSRLYPNRP